MVCASGYRSNFWRVFAAIGLLLVSLSVRADAGSSVGEAVFVGGEVWADAGTGRVALLSGNRLAAGTSLQTGENGFVYIRMGDGGFFVLRPGSRARIVNYETDLATPGNSRLRLDLESGHARAISGEAARRSPGSFRLNTPVAAIGVRGTDFSVSTTADITRVTVSEGAVVVDKLGAGCSADTLGPCRSALAQALMATDKQSLEVRRNETALRRESLEDSKTSVDKSASATSVASNSRSENAASRLNDSTIAPATAGAPVVVPEEAQRIFWGRWRAVENLPVSAGLAEGLKKNEGFSDWPIFSLWREAGSAPTLPVQGQWTFRLSGHESYFLVGTPGAWTALPTQVKDAALSIDLAQRAFSTRLTVFNEAASANLQAQGKVDATGRFLWEYAPGTNMSVQGLIAGQNGQQAGYIYNSQLGPNVWATGATSWRRP